LDAVAQPVRTGRRAREPADLVGQAVDVSRPPRRYTSPSPSSYVVAMALVRYLHR
jgi:hypothetical protein